MAKTSSLPRARRSLHTSIKTLLLTSLNSAVLLLLHRLTNFERTAAALSRCMATSYCLRWPQPVGRPSFGRRSRGNSASDRNSCLDLLAAAQVGCALGKPSEGRALRQQQ